jgi:hypothetical protein
VTLYLILIYLGLLVAVVGNIWLIVAAFRVSVVWALCVIFVPFALFVFVARHWKTAKWAFLCGLLGPLLVATSAALDWDEISKTKTGAAMVEVATKDKQLAGLLARFRGKPSATPAPNQKPETPLMKQERLARMQDAFVQHAAELKAKYDVLQKQWAALKPNDKAGRAAFDQEAAVYQTMRKQVETEKGDIEALAAVAK